jgi:uncharacterized YccA/Bax inhibitor family protein
MATTNPIFRDLGIPQPSHLRAMAISERMTLVGTLHKTGMLLALFAISTVLGWKEFGLFVHGPTKSGLYFLLGFVVSCLIGGWVLVWVTVRHKTWSTITAPIYAFLQGLLMGFISTGEDFRFSGIAIQAVCVTIAMSSCLLLAYRFGWIRVTGSFNRKLTVAISGVVLFYMANIAMALSGVPTFATRAGVIPSILISVVVVGIAGMSLVSDFDSAVLCADEGNPKYMEWYAALGLLVSLVWLYIEVLNLLGKARRAEEESL